VGVVNHVVISDEVAAFAAALRLCKRFPVGDAWGAIAFTVETAGLGSYHPGTIEAAAESWMLRHLDRPELPPPGAVHAAIARLRTLPR
jgi:hypothetical protein